ncbi:hypothetical protein LTR85_011828 [Meristemomyces frigidus]|nr:hypothetical protein LTR85_011828 [Meristemomyces frigidus]
MARERRPAQASTTSSRKRTRQEDEADDDVPAASSSKRSNREPSPSKHVIFKRRLESGPTRSRADHRHQSPVRGAMRSAQTAAEEAQHDEEDDDEDESRYIQSEVADADLNEDQYELAPDPLEEWTIGDDLGATSLHHPETAGSSKKPAVRSKKQTVERQSYTLRIPHDKIDYTGQAPQSPTTPEDTEEDEPSTKTSRAGSRTPSVSRAQGPKSGPSSPAATAGRSLPPAPLNDDSVCTNLHKLRDAVKAFADSFPAPETSNADVFSQLLKPGNEQTVRYIGFLALGGKDGEDSWKQLLSDHECQKALVFGIIGRALKESVFGELWFGATEKQHKELSDLEESSVDLDERCLEFAKHDNDQANVMSLLKAKAKVVVQLEKLLQPLAAIQAARPGARRLLTPVSLNTPALATVVSMAADLSRAMRLMGHVVYYWPPTFKDEEFEPARMESNNLKYMIEKSPYEKKEMHGRVRAVLLPNRADRSEAIVRVVCFPGLVAYKQGGGAMGVRLLEEEGRRERNSHVPADVREVDSRRARHGGITEESGFRSKVICKAVVHLEWGKQRLLTKEAGTSAHLDAMRDHSNNYEEDRNGFKELFDIFLQRNSCLNCGGLGHRAGSCPNPSRGTRGMAWNPITLGTAALQKPEKAAGPAAGAISRPSSG